MAQQLGSTPIQKHLEIEEIKEDVMILRGGGLRTVLMANSINFFLKSIKEQEATIYRFQDFLNSLDFTVQILVVSRKFDISPYLSILTQKANEQENELLKIQALEYIDFVRGLTELVNIMQDSFYIVVPYSSSVIEAQGWLDKLLGRKKEIQKEEQSFEEMKNSLWQRANFVSTGLRGLGINAVPLKTKELIELFYKLYNPESKEKIGALQEEQKS